MKMDYECLDMVKELHISYQLFSDIDEFIGERYWKGLFTKDVVHWNINISDDLLDKVLDWLIIHGLVRKTGLGGYYEVYNHISLSYNEYEYLRVKGYCVSH